MGCILQGSRWESSCQGSKGGANPSSSGYTACLGQELNHKRHAKSLTFTATKRLGIRCIGLKLMIDMDRPDSAGTAMAVGCQVQ